MITRLLTACLLRNDGTTYSDHGVFGSGVLTEVPRGCLPLSFPPGGGIRKLKFNCTQTDCLELIRIELDLVRFIQAEQSILFSCRPVPETELELRLPNGLDQLNWINNLDDTTANRFSEMALSLISRVNGEKPSQRFRVCGELARPNRHGVGSA